MVIDTSAIAAILLREPDREQYALAIYRERRRLISAVTRVELTCVIEGRKGAVGRVLLDNFLELVEPEIVPVSVEQTLTAIEAFRRYGKGQGHPAQLNIGDCFSYALAIATDQPLLFKGGDFTATDVRSALAA